MDIGKMIRICREKQGLSPESLAQKLGTDADTINRWETRREDPSVEDLLRLKSAFGVSADTLLSDDPLSVASDIPEESYRFQFAVEEMKRSGRAWLRQSLRMPLIMILCIFVIFTVNLLQEFDLKVLLIGLSLLLILAAFIVGIIRSVNKRNKIDFFEVAQNDYCYDLFDRYMIVRIIKKGVMLRYSRITYEEIHQIRDCGNLLNVVFNGNIFFFRKSDLKENSRLFELYRTVNALPKR